MTADDISRLEHQALTDPVRASLTEMGKTIDEALYSPIAPSAEASTLAWQLEHDIWLELRGRVAPGRRFAGMIDPRPLFERDAAVSGGSRADAKAHVSVHEASRP